MIRINQNQINRFKLTHCEYLYYVSRGCFLVFDKDSLEYIGIELFYLPSDYNLLSKKCEDKIEYLLSRDILEYND